MALASVVTAPMTNTESRINTSWFIAASEKGLWEREKEQTHWGEDIISQEGMEIQRREINLLYTHSWAP